MTVEPMTIESLAVSADDAQMLECERFSIEQVSRYFGISRSVIQSIEAEPDPLRG